MAARTIASNSAVAVEDDGGVADGWGDDADLDLDGEEKAVGSTGNAESGDDEGGWEVGDEDLELPSDLSAVAHGGEDEDRGYYVPPTRGQPPLQGWATHSQLAIDHASAGSYESAFRLLHDQIGVVNFAPFKYVYCKVFVCKQTVYCSIPIIRPLFTAAFAKARTMFAGLPNLPSLAAYPQRNWREAAASSKVHGLPALGVRLADVAERLQVGWEFK